MHWMFRSIRSIYRYVLLFVLQALCGTHVLHVNESGYDITPCDTVGSLINCMEYCTVIVIFRRGHVCVFLPWFKAADVVAHSDMLSSQNQTINEKLFKFYGG